MPPAIRVSFAISGEKELLRTFASIEKRAQGLASVEAKAARASEAASAKRASASIKASDKAAKASELAAAKQIKAEEAAARRIEKIKERSAIMAGRYAEKAARAEATAAQRESRTRAAGRVGAVGRAGRSTLGSIAGVAGGMGVAAGGYAITSALMAAMSLEEKAALLANSAKSKDVKGYLTGARRVATDTGFKAEDVMTAMGTVSARSGKEGLAALMGKDIDDVAKTAKAAGVSMEDMGGVYAAAFKAGVKPGEEMQQLMRDLVEQGKSGAVEFSDLASELARLGGAGRKFGNGADMLRKVSGWAQLAVESKVSPEESRTAVVDMLREFTMAEKIKGMTGMGVNVTKGGKLNDPAEIMADLIMGIEGGKKFGGKGKNKYGGKTNEDKLGAYGYMFTGSSNDLALGLRDTFLKAGGGTAGRAAVMERIRGAEGKSGAYSAKDRDEEYQRVMGTSKAQVDLAIEKFKVEISKMLPEFAKLLPSILQVTQGFAKLAVWVTENPFPALGALFAAHLAKELAAAKIADLIRNLVTSSAGGGGGGVGGKAAGAVAAGAAAFAGGYAAGTYGYGEGEERGKPIRETYDKHLNATAELWQRARKGKLTSEDTDTIAKLRDEAFQNAKRVYAEDAANEELTTGWGAINPLAHIEQSAYEAERGSANVENINKVIADLDQLSAMARKVAAAGDAAEIAAGKIANLGDVASRNGKPPAGPRNGG